MLSLSALNQNVEMCCCLQEFCQLLPSRVCFVFIVVFVYVVVVVSDASGASSGGSGVFNTAGQVLGSNRQ